MLSKRCHYANRVLIVISSLGGGGAERVALDLCSFLRECGREVILLTLCGDDPDAYPLPPGILRERMEIRRPSRSVLDTVVFTSSHLAAMRRKQLELQPDVVVSFMDQTNVRVLTCMAGTQIPVIVSERVHPDAHQIPWAWKVSRRLTYPLASAVVVQSAEIATWFKGWLDPRRLAVIPNAVRIAPQSTGTSPFQRERFPARFVLAVGRLTRQKGFDLLLEAFRRSKIADREWCLVILGEGPDRDALKRLSIELGIDQAVLMPGFVSNVGAWMSHAEVFVLSSRYEGFPNALIEAMQLGKACLSFDCPSGPRDLIDHGLNGWLVREQDVDALAGALRHITDDPVLRSRFGVEAGKVGELFSPGRVYSRWLDLIDGVIKGGGARRPETHYGQEDRHLTSL